MKLLCKKTVLSALLITAFNLCLTTDASQVTTYLQPLDNAVTNRLTNTNLSHAARKALRRADAILTHDADSKQKELGLLGAAARTLKPKFDDDFLMLEWDALDAYSADAHGLWGTITNVIGTNAVSRSIRNNLKQGTNALARGDNTNSPVTARTRALATSLTKLGKAAAAVIDQFGFEAPANLEGYRSVRLEEAVIINDQTFYNLETTGWIYDAHGPNHEEELGLWSYTKQSTNKAIITVMPNYPSNDVPRDFKLTFTNFASGLFSGTNVSKKFIQGTFQLNPF